MAARFSDSDILDGPRFRDLNPLQYLTVSPTPPPTNGPKINIDKRKKNLVSKAKELSILCQVPVGVIIYTDNQDSSNPADIYTSNPVELRQILCRYIECPKEDRDNRAKNMVDIVTAKNGHLPRLIWTVGGENDPVGPKYSGWVSGLDRVDKDGLVEVVSKLNGKIEKVRSRVQFLKTRKRKTVRILPRPPPPLQQPQSTLPWDNLYGKGDQVNFEFDGSYYTQPDNQSPIQTLRPFHEAQAMQFQIGAASSSSSFRPSTSLIDQSPSTSTMRRMMMDFMTGASSSSNSLPPSSVDPKASTPTMQRMMMDFMPYQNTGFMVNDEDDGLLDLIDDYFFAAGSSSDEVDAYDELTDKSAREQAFSASRKATSGLSGDEKNQKQVFAVWNKEGDRIGKVLQSGVPNSDEIVLTRMGVMFDRVLLDIEESFEFSPYHKALWEPFDYYLFGQNYIRPLIDFSNSYVGNVSLFYKIEEKLQQGHNIILMSNHQTEPDPVVIGLLLETVIPHIVEDMIYVARDRVITDPLCKPFSMGRNLLCVYSKKHMHDNLELVEMKRRSNTRSLEEMALLLREGAKVIWIAPSGGRDHPDPITEDRYPAPFDVSSVDNMRRLVVHSVIPGHIYPLAILCHDIMPPPLRVEKEIGEKRVISFHGTGVSVAQEINYRNIADDFQTDSEAKSAYAKAISKTICHKQ